MQIELCEALDDFANVRDPGTWEHLSQGVGRFLINRQREVFVPNNKGLITMQTNEGTRTQLGGLPEPPIPPAAWKGLFGACKLSR